MTTNIKKIRIESILGGMAATTHFAQADQFRACLAIDPGQPIDDADSNVSTIASGILRPTGSQKFSGAVLTAAPLWMIPNPKDANIYVYDALGSTYSMPATFNALTALSDAGATTNGRGNGADYYDNYIYFFLPTDVARYGPLNGAPGFVPSYWVGVLGKTALTNTTYPATFKHSTSYPNHCAKRHSDGKLYFGDVTGNQGQIHYIRTSKAAVEGDTNNGSTYGALTLGYGLYPGPLESYGTDLAIPIFEGTAANLRQTRAKMAFWDTTSTNFNKIIWVEFPDPLITAQKNINGVLYVVSGNVNAQGFRVVRFAGGYSYEEVYYSETGEPCLPGAIDGLLQQLHIGTHTNVPESAGVVLTKGLQKRALGTPVFNTMVATGATASTVVTALLVADNNEMGFQTPVIGWSNGPNSAAHGFDKQGTQYNNVAQAWWSQTFRVGRPFNVKRIRMPFAAAIAANMILDVTVYTDDGSASYTGDAAGLPTVNNTTFPNGERYANFQPQQVTGYNNFFIGIRWTGAVLLPVGLPIEIEYEVIEDM